MRQFLDIARTGTAAAGLHPARSAATVLAVLAALFPYLVGLGVSTGVRDAADAAVQNGADLYVSGEQFGRPVPVPVALGADLERIPGVDRVVPRIVGRIELGAEHVRAVVVGVPVTDFPADVEFVDGRLYAGGTRNELVVGTDLARQLHLAVGSYLPPFYRSREGERVSEVVGVFKPDAPLWQGRLIVTSVETAAHIFDQPGLATDLLVYCRPGYTGPVREAVLQARPDGRRLRAIAREDAAALVPEGPRYREGVFTLLFAVAFAVAILVVLVTSGFGLADRRREVGILKAAGWQTDELLLRTLTESLLLALLAASLAVVLAAIWLTALNGYGIAGIFLAGTDTRPAFRVPFRLTPVPVLLAYLIAAVVVAAGSLYSTWRSATAPPREAMR